MAGGNDTDRYVQPSRKGGWEIVKEGHARVSARTSTKDQAVERAREIIHNLGGGEVRIKNQRGQLIDSDTITGPRHDESPVRDRK
jgi:hypothetical protein